MGGGSILHELAAIVAPPLCGVCGAPCPVAAALCGPCARALEHATPGSRVLPEVGEVAWAAPHHGVARGLVGALKFGGRTALASVAAARIAASASPRVAPAAVVAVPPASPRLRRRGFDPTGLIASEVARLLGIPRDDCLVRLDAGRQVGRPRAARLADPPRIRCRRQPPPRALLVDDVLTTGASLRACAAALRDCGEAPVGAAVFAAALGSRAGAA